MEALCYLKRGKMVNQRKYLLFLASILFVTVCAVSFAAAIVPTGANSSSFIKTGTSPNQAPDSRTAYAGNVSEILVNGLTTTQTWQGFYGNVTGTVELADSNHNVMYNWSLASPGGEIYASTNSSISWPYVQCFNFTSNGTYADDTANAGATSQFGANLSIIQTRFNINISDVDGVNRTFARIGAGGHTQFYTANQQFSAGECSSTRVYDNTGAGVAGKFEEALLYEPTSTSLIFATLLNTDANGFDSQTHDFEMLVLEDGHGTNTASTTYFFFVELQ